MKYSAKTKPGMGDPYWYEWSVGQQYIIDMFNPEVIDNHIHVISLAKSFDLLIEKYRKETIRRLIADPVEYIFMEDNQNE